MQVLKSVLFLVCWWLVSHSLGAQHWLTDFEQAKEIAARDQRNIILVFQGSDWCAPCIKLDQSIWSTPEFQSYAKDHFVMLLADFPRKKINRLSAEQQVHNGHLAEIYNQQGHFPLVVILESDGTVIGKTGYKNLSVADYIKHLESIKG